VQEVDDPVRVPHSWRGDVKAVHVEIKNTDAEPRMVRVKVMGGARDGEVIREVPVLANSRFRFISCKSARDDTGIVIEFPATVDLKCYEVYDRAHFPTQEVDVGHHAPNSDAVPEPVFIGLPRAGGR
jgi:pyruvate formate lyase activating enzyme